MSEKKKEPDMKHCSSKDFEHVYEPAEDTYLLLDALTAEASFLQSLKPAVCLEIGSGSGILSAHLAHLLPNTFVWATDVNPRAVRLTARTLACNRSRGDVLCARFAGPLLARLKGAVDVLVFNPPYVPTPREEMEGNGISVAWAGGRDGREVLDAFFPQLEALLGSRGVAYLILLHENKPDEVVKRLQLLKLRAREVARRVAGRERLFVYRVQREVK